jgi:heavy metal translocating P-type ATPase
MKKEDSISSNKYNECIHCKTLFKEFANSTKRSQFCCFGCETVYNILTKSNLGQYYKLKETSESFRPSSPVKSSTTSFDFLDKETSDSITFFLEGVHCVACLWLIEHLGTLVEGVDSIQLNIGTSQAIITKQPTGKFSKIAACLDQLGYHPHFLTKGSVEDLQKKERRQSLLRIGLSAALAGNIMLFSVALYVGSGDSIAELFRWGSGVLSLPLLFYTAQPFYKGARASLLSKSMTIDVPVVIAIIGGSILSFSNLLLHKESIYFDSISVFIFLLLSTRHFFKYTSQKLDNDQLLHTGLIPMEARKCNESGFSQSVLSKDLIKDDVIEVWENEVVPVDGFLFNCEGHIDTHVITGESMPLQLKAGAAIYAGMKNSGKKVKVTVDCVGSDTRLGKLTNEIRCYKKPPLVQVADKISKRFLGVTLTIGVGVFLWEYFINHSLSTGFDRSLALLILACPCALSLATPMAYALSVNRAAKHGICIKNADVLEKTDDVDTVVFDKTGTLTTGQLSVIAWENFDDKIMSYKIVRRLEEQSKHPIAKAITRYLNEQHFYEVADVKDCEEVIGTGVKGVFEGKRVEIKSLSSFEDSEIDAVVTVVGLFKDNELITKIQLGDSLFPSSKPTIATLKTRSLNTILLSGDREETVKQVAAELSIETVYFSKTPEDKVSIMKTYPRGLMIGDGANDAAALNKSWVSVAVQGSLEVSLTAADVYFTVPGISKLPFLFNLSKRTKRLVRVNFALALFYNVIGIILVLFGVVSPLFAAILMPISSLTVFLVSWSGLR